jgi:hypothetical protein
MAEFFVVLYVVYKLIVMFILDFHNNEFKLHTKNIMVMFYIYNFHKGCIPYVEHP